MLRVQGVSVRQGGRTLWQGLDFTLAPGERLAIAAPSGHGKTTLGRVLAGWQAPSCGHILWQGAPLPASGYCPVQLVPQHPELTFNPYRSTGAALHDAWQPTAADLVACRIDPEWLRRRPHALSGGELARIALLRALDPRTRVLIADEVTAQLDPAIQLAIWQHLVRLCRERGLAMIIFSHQQALLDQAATRRLKW